MPQSSRPDGSFATLRRFIRRRTPVERCDRCSAMLATDHQHLLEPTSRQLLCACDACTILFSNQSQTTYRRIPQRSRCLPDFRLTDAQWESLMIPIGMAFFFYSTPAGKVIAMYPSPAGPTESLLDLESWHEIVQNNPILLEMEPDVEAFLVNRVGSGRAYYLVPIDACYRLVGLIRTYWRGLSGGTEVWTAIGQFFAELQQRSSAIREESRA